MMKETLEKKIKKSKLHECIRTESLLRDTSNHYLRLIGDSDRKARIMIVVNSLLLTGGLTIITKVIHNQPMVWISATILIIANLMALFFTIMSVKPDLQSHISKETENNMLLYHKCREFSLAEYAKNILNTLHDNDKKIDAKIKEIYFFGNLLDAKYRLMQIAYRFFIWGIVFSITSYLVILFITQSSWFK
jgi:hypothetical protein